jgi:endoglucanase
MEVWMKEKSIALLRQLTEAHGAPGHEAAVREIFRNEVGLPCETDGLGNTMCVKEGEASDPKIMITGHMDEVGFVVQSITSEGLLRFVPVGGWWGHVLLAQRVRVLTWEKGEVLGVITSKPPHFLARSERDKVMTLDKMYIDIGARSDDEVRDVMGVQIGDTIVPDSSFVPFGPNDYYMCKAFDNRVGVGLSIQAIQELANRKHPNTVYSVATVQEEVGTRGAQVAPRMCNPDLAIILEGTPADDMPGVGKDERQAVLGKGGQLRWMDPTAISNRNFANFVRKTSKELDIPCQIAVRRSGGTDAKVIHLHGQGVPTIVLGVPSRYIHTHNSVININDYVHSLALLLALLERLDADTVKSFTTY